MPVTLIAKRLRPLSSAHLHAMGPFSRCPFPHPGPPPNGVPWVAINYETVKFFDNTALEVERYDRARGEYATQAVKVPAIPPLPFAGLFTHKAVAPSFRVSVCWCAFVCACAGVCSSVCMAPRVCVLSPRACLRWLCGERGCPSTGFSVHRSGPPIRCSSRCCC